MATLIVAVAAGATLQLGPLTPPAAVSAAGKSYPKQWWLGTLGDLGAPDHVAEGADLLLVVHQLADNWRHR
jgi:hypothetical protein